MTPVKTDMDMDEIERHKSCLFRTLLYTWNKRSKNVENGDPMEDARIERKKPLVVDVRSETTV